MQFFGVCMAHFFWPTSKIRGGDKNRQKSELYFCVCSGSTRFFGSGPADGGKRVGTVRARLATVLERIRHSTCKTSASHLSVTISR